MYQQHWKLTANPFRVGHQVRFYYESPTHEEALARLHFLVEQRRRLGILLGTAGVGKSYTLDVFAARLRRSGRLAIKLSLLGREEHEFIWRLAAALGLNPCGHSSVLRLWRKLDDRLTALRFEQRDLVLMLDDAVGAAPEALTHVVRLLESELAAAGHLTIVAAAQTTGSQVLDPRLVEAAELRIDLLCWEIEETAQYLQHALELAGCQRPLFDIEAIRRIHALSGGIPRRVNRVAELALLAGAGNGLDQIDEETVDAVHQELELAEDLSVGT